MDDAALPPPDVTAFLEDLAAGRAEGDVVRLQHVLQELRVIAAAHMRRQGAGHTLQPTALVNAAYLKLFRGAPKAWKDRRHFFTVASKAMRQVLVDHARSRMRQKRGGGRHVGTLVDMPSPGAPTDEDVVGLDAALDELASFDARKAQVVELKYFGGFDVAGIADMLGASTATIEREWRAARAWLAMRLRPTG
ncbi:MAG: ECF-type sigma factor [Planctomycetota bacterium]